MKKKVLKYTIGIIGAIGIIVLAVVLFVFRTTSVHLDHIAIHDVTLADNTLTVDGNINASAEGYRGYKYNIEDHVLYLDIKGGLVTKKHPSGTIDIVIEDEQLKDVDRVYLKQRKDKLAIYSSSH